MAAGRTWDLRFGHGKIGAFRFCSGRVSFFSTRGWWFGVAVRGFEALVALVLVEGAWKTTNPSQQFVES